MRRILITERIKGIAQTYAQELALIKKGNPKDRLLTLSNSLKKSSASIWLLKKGASKGYPAVYSKHKGNAFIAPSEYVKAIYDHYDGLNALLPSEYFDRIGKYVDPKLAGYEICNIKVKLPKKRRQPLYELIVEAMRYSTVQKDIISKYIRQVGIKTCVYCNAQFATTASIQEMKLVKRKLLEVTNTPASCYELDHNKPKSKYPYLCTNFYNLQPCCSSCNRRKNDRELDFSLYYEDGDIDTTPVHFAMAESDIIHFRISNNGKGIKPYLCNEGVDTPPSVADKSSMAGKLNDMLNVQGIYDEHEDIVEEILWRHKIYSSGFMTATNNQIKSLGLDGFDMKRFILGGYYDREGDFLRRPLSIMKNDLWEQLDKTR